MPTHFPTNGGTPSIIDIIINKNVTKTTNPISNPDLPSDHNPIKFTVQTKMICSIEPKIFTSYNNTNWDKYRQ